MTAGTSSNSLHSTIPYKGPDRLTTLPAEILQNVASNLGGKSLQRLRLANRSACDKITYNFVHTFLHSRVISTTKSGIESGLRALQIENPSTATKVVKFTQPYGLYGNADVVVFGSGSKSRPYRTHANIPSMGDIKAVVKHMPNVNTLVIKDVGLESEVPQSLCRALAAAPRMQLTGLTIDGARLSGKVLINLLHAHKRTLRSLVIRWVHSTDGLFVKKMIETLSSPGFNLTELTIDNIGEGEDRHNLTPFMCTLLGTHNGVSLNANSPDCDTWQQCTLFYQPYVLWAMHGHRAVEMGLEHILNQISEN
jgi:hypothetical protein